VLGEDGMAEVWALDFDLKSFDSCDDDDELIFSFNAAGTQLALEFDCSDIPNGIAEEIPLQMYVIDTDGNSEYCDVVLILQDSQGSNACIDNLDGNKATIAGAIMTNQSEGLLNIEVELMNMDEQDSDMQMTENAGEYAFNEVDYYNEYAVEPYKNDDASNGVSTIDLVMIQRHILGLSELDSPYKLIAADVNGNDKVTSSDLLLMRKVILGIETKFDDNTSWRFIPTTHEIEDPTNPFGFPEKVVINGLYVSDEHIDFTAIKVGDINGNASTNIDAVKESTVRSAAKLLLIEDKKLFTNETISVPVYANELSELVGLQLTLDLGNDVVFKGIKSNALDIIGANVNAKGNNVSLSWNTSEAITLHSHDILFTLELDVISDGELASNVGLTTAILNNEAYDNALKTSSIDLEISNRDISTIERSALYQNVPNPFKGMTTIAFDLEESGLATLAIFDISGKELYRLSNDFTKGKNAITVDVESLNASSGILYYTLKAGNFIDTKKMMIID
jgi:hypothetical protein